MSSSLNTGQFNAEMDRIDKQLEQDQLELLNNMQPPEQVVEQKKEEKKEPKQAHDIPTTTFRHNGIDYPILTTHTPFPIVQRIMTHNSVTGYTGIINAGQSGTGKTTWTKWLVHQLHLAMPAVVVDWYEQYDMQSIDNIINNLTKGVPHIMVFDDASFALDDMPRKEVNKLAQVLTRIRHHVKANVISILNIHYSKAIGKYWRNIPFYFLTSISNEELGSYEDVFGSGAKWKLRDFSYLFHDMMLDGGWRIEIDAWSGDAYKYKTNQPFRIGLASELNRLHFFVYVKDSCAFCDKDFDTKRVISARDMVDQLVQAYNKPQVRSTLRYYLLTRKGKENAIDRRVRSLWHTISDLDRKNDIDWNDVVKVLDDTLVNKRKRWYKKEGQKEAEVKAIEKKATIHGETHKNSIVIDPTVLEGKEEREVQAMDFTPDL